MYYFIIIFTSFVKLFDYQRLIVIHMKHSIYPKVLSSLVLCATMLLFVAQTSCVKELYQEEEEKETPPVPPEEKPTDDDFEFSPVSKCRLSINYDLKGQAIPFQVYYENPILDENNNTLNEDLMPNFAGWTNENGVYSEEFSIPTAIKTVYITTRAIGVPGCVIVSVENNQINFDMSSPQTKAGLRAANTHTITPNMLTLGNWNEKGVPDYLIERAEILPSLLNSINATLPSVNDKTIYDRHSDYFNGSIPQAIRIKAAAEVNLLFITESANMANTLGYYHYPTGQKPTTISEIERIIAFPCANFSTHTDKNTTSYWGALYCGAQMHLQYWDGKKFNNEFPANTTIEFFLLPSAFKKEVGNNNEKPGDIKENNGWARTKYTDINLNTDKKPASIALYDTDKKLVALGFEDKNFGETAWDHDFNDVVFTVRTTPDTALDGDGMPNLEPGEVPPPSIEYGDKGTLAFEDLWPSQGDYDMNDVVVYYNSTLHINQQNNILRLDNEITVKWNGGSILNGFGYQLGVPSNAIKSCAITAEGTGSPGNLEGGQSLATIILFNNAQEATGTTYNVVTEFSQPQPQEKLQPPYNPFIIPGLGNGDRSKEVHLTNKKPTDLMDASLLGKYNDQSDVSAGKYYVSKDNFPFAIYVPGEFRIPKERVRIDAAYPRFTDWVTSGGKNNEDWYLHPDEDNVYPVAEEK